MGNENRPVKCKQSFTGGCPICGDSTAMLNIGRDHYAYCSEHKTAWHFGGNLISSWRLENEEKWERNKLFLADYTEVKGLFPQSAEEWEELLEKDRREDEAKRATYTNRAYPKFVDGMN